MKKFVYLIYSLDKVFDENEGRDEEIIEAVSTLEKAINVINALTGDRYNCSRIRRQIDDYEYAGSRYIPLSNDIHDGSIPYEFRMYWIRRIRMA